METLVPRRERTHKWLAELSARLEAYEASDPFPFGPLIIAFGLYLLIMFAAASRPLWHDELYTYYIAQAPTLKLFIWEITHIDIQAPLQFVLSRFSIELLGDSSLATRLPSMLAFTIASVCFYQFVRQRMGRFYGVTAMLVFWCTPFMVYAGEARPYALVLGFLGVAMLGWQTAIEGRRRWLGLLAITFGVWGMIVSQPFSPLIVAFLGLGELIRSLDRRKIDWPVWGALVAPSPFVLVYIPMFRRYEGWGALPPEFKASVSKMITFYADLMSATGAVLLVALVAALLVFRSQEPTSETQAVSPRKHEIALALGLLSLPILINLVLMQKGGAFWPRYCISSGIGFSLLFVYLLSKFTNGSRAAAAIAGFCVFFGIVGSMAVRIMESPNRAVVKQISLQQLDPKLPIVDASGLTFLEMNKRENSKLTSRVFYLTDRDAAIHFAQATIFEGTERLRQYWPLPGTVMPYLDFVQKTPHFFVLGTPDYPEDWLIPKLLDDGANLAFKGELQRSGYKDRMIFEVTMPSTNLPSR